MRAVAKTEGESSAERAREELWRVSVAAYNARCGEERRLELLEYHEGQVRRLSNTLGSLVAYHEREAQRYRNGHHEERNGHHGD